MTFWRLAWKRNLHSPALLLSLAVFFLLLLLAPGGGRSVRYAPAGVADLSDTPFTRALKDNLTDQGFLPVEGEEELRRLVASGELDCGLVLTGAVEAGEPPVLLVSPASQMAEAYRFAAAAELFRLRAPGLSAAWLPSSISAHEVEEAYWRMDAQGHLFRFRVEGLPSQVEELRAEALLRGALSLLLYVLSGAFVLGPLRGALSGAARTLGLRRALRRVILPHIGVRLLLLAATAALGLGLGGGWAWLLPALVYLLLLTGLRLLLAALLPREGAAWTLLALGTLGGLALHPIYMDPTALHPLLALCQRLCPACWLYAIPAAPLPWLAAALLLPPLGGLCLVLRLRWQEKLT